MLQKLTDVPSGVDDADAVGKTYFAPVAILDHAESRAILDCGVYPMSMSRPIASGYAGRADW